MTNKQLIANSISDIRLVTKSIDLNNKNDQDIFMSFKNLSKFVFENFDIPSTHQDYVEKSFKNRNAVISYSIDKFTTNIGNYYNIELPLRAIEVLFLYIENEENVHDINKLIELKYLIATLHQCVGRKYFKLEEETIFSLS